MSSSYHKQLHYKRKAALAGAVYPPTKEKNSEPSFPWIVRWQQLKVLVSEIPWRLIGARCKYRRSL